MVQVRAREATTAGPTLESGDRLTSEEFRRRYELRPDLKKAELINGMVYVASPVRMDEHGDPHSLLVGAIVNYRLTHPRVRSADNTTVRFEDGSEVQPDVLLRYTRRAGGASKLQDRYVYGPPELCAEIAASSASYDLHNKKELYRRMGVREYLVWRVEDGAFDWWELVDGEYAMLPATPAGEIESRVFPGLKLDLAGLLRTLDDAIEADEEAEDG